MVKAAIILVIILALLIGWALVSGCAPVRVQFSDNEITANSGGIIASREINADGSISQKISTDNRNWWDAIKTGGVQITDMIGGVWNRTNVQANK